MPAKPTTKRVLANRARPLIGAPSSTASLVARTNRWREQYNPLRGLTIARAIQLLETYYRGDMADLQWTYFFIEQTDPDLFALVERRTSAILEMDWNIKIVPENRRRLDFDEKLANDQAAILREAYDRIENLYEAIEHLAMASFRGYAHLEKQGENENLMPAPDAVTCLEVVDQWNVVRDGMCGDWKYNPEAQQTTFATLPADSLMEPQDFVMRTTRRHINRIALIKFIRANLSEKDWDAFIEIYGIPSGVITMPSNVPQEKEAEYQSAAKEVAEGGSGAIPYGSTYTPNDGPRGVNPFNTRLEYLSQKLILAGTGGMLTMLAQSGSGTLAGNAHAETFKKIAKSEGRKISEALQRSFDKALLADAFPGQPVLAYFELAFQSETDSSQVVKDVKDLSAAGFELDAAQITEKTGYKLVKKAAPATGPVVDPNADPDADPATDAALKNRQLFNVADATKDFATATAADLAPIFDRLWKITEIKDDAIFAAKAQSFLGELPQLLADITADPAAARSLYQSMSKALVKGLTQRRNP